MTKDTDKKTRDDTYVGAAVRAEPRGGYELRVFPKPRRFQLLKSGEVLEEDREKNIAGLDEEEQLQISVIGTPSRQGQRQGLAEFKDKNAEQVKGRKTAMTFGAERTRRRR